jgi:transcriptional regulator with XRE-family HTH domain
VTEQDWYDRLGAMLRQERQRRGWTIYDVGSLVNRSGMWVSVVERGLRRMKAYDYDLLRREGLVR